MQRVRVFGQVMTDYVETIKRDAGPADAEDVARWQTRMAQFMEAHEAEQLRKKDAINLGQARQWNVLSIRALDNSMSSCGLLLTDFQATTMPKPLLHGGSRITVPAHELLDEGQLYPGCKCRVLTRTDAGDSFAADWSCRKPFLGETLDECGKQWYSRYWLFGPAMVRGTCCYDNFHRRHNTYSTSICRAGVGMQWQEAQLFVSFKKGPFKGASNLGVVEKTAEQYFATQHALECPLFALAYPFIVRYMNQGVLPAKFGSREHMETTWDECRRSRWLRCSGTIVKRSRWFDTHAQLEENLPHFGVALLIILVIAMERKYYTCIAETPLCAAAPRVVPEVEGVIAAAPGPLHPAASTTSVQKQFKERRGAQSTLHLVAEILCTPISVPIWQMIVLTGKPVYAAHTAEMEASATQMGTRVWQAERAAGAWSCIVEDIAFVASDEKALRRVGFELDEQIAADDLRSCDEKALAAALSALQREQIAGTIRDSMHFSHTLPGIFSGLISDVSSERQTCFQYVRKTWESYLVVESEAADDEWCAEFIHDLLWPDNGYCMEVIIGAAECDFSALPPVAEQELRDIVRDARTTLRVERLMNVERDSERQHKASKLGRLARWHRALQSPVLQDAEHGRLCALPCDASSAKGNLGKTICDPTHRVSSLGLAAEAELREGPGKWSQPKPEHLHLASCRNHAMVLVNGNTALLKNMWQSLLARPGTLLARKPSDDAPWSCVGLVVQATEFGVFVLSCALRQVDKDMYVCSCQKKGEVMWAQVCITDYAAWTVMDVEEVPPACSQAVLGRIMSGVLLHPLKTTKRPLMDAAALDAFCGLTLPQLMKVKTLLGVPGPKHVNEFEARRRLMAKVLPRLTPSQIADIIKEKTQKSPPPRFDATISEHDACHVDCILGADEVKVVKEYVAAQKAAAALAQHSNASAKKAGGHDDGDVSSSAPTAASSSKAPIVGGGGSPSSRKLILPPGDSYTKDQAGCKWVKDITRHMRWHIHYPTGRSPYSTSMAWNATVSEFDCVCWCLAWAWSEHKRCTGEEAPFDIPKSKFT